MQNLKKIAFCVRDTVPIKLNVLGASRHLAGVWLKIQGISNPKSMLIPFPGWLTSHCCLVAMVSPPSYLKGFGSGLSHCAPIFGLQTIPFRVLHTELIIYRTHAQGPVMVWMFKCAGAFSSCTGDGVGW